MIRAFAPGRVNLIGEHTDYAGGQCLPFAIAAGVTVTAWPLPDRTVEVEALAPRESDAFDLDDVAKAPGWRAYVRGTAAELDRAKRLPHGARLEVDADLPMGAGLGSSAALCVAVRLGLAAAAAVEPEADPWELARLLSKVESEWAGAQTGMLDQLACLLGRPGHAVLLDFDRRGSEQVPLELGDWSLAVLPSGAVRSNTGSEFNRRRIELEQGHPARVRHVESENARVRETVGALRRGDLPALGPLIAASHRSLRDDLEVSVPEVEAAVERAMGAGAAGARIHGGGFGGGVLALFPPGSNPPAGALRVAPCGGARLL